MRFCKDCGAVLNLFGTNEKELCSACIQQQKKHRPPVPKQETADIDLLADATLKVTGAKLVLCSKEGWELWSGPTTEPVPLKTVIARAKRIYEIRLRRQKN